MNTYITFLTLFNFADNAKSLMSLLSKEVLYDPKPYLDQLLTMSERPSREEAVAQHLSRFSQVVGETPHTDQPDQETPGVSG